MYTYILYTTNAKQPSIQNVFGITTDFSVAKAFKGKSQYKGYEKVKN